MKKQEVIDFFGGVPSAAAALRMTRAGIYQWGENVPKARQKQIEQLTGGALKEDLSPWEKLQQEAANNGQG